MPFIDRQKWLRIFVFLFSFCLLRLSQAETESANEDSSSHHVFIAEFSKEILIPEIFWEKAQVTDGDQVTFAKLDVLITEKTPGVVNNKHVQISYPLGGGHLDLDKFLSKEITGSYYITFLPQFEDNDERREVFFLSNSRRRKYESSVAGSGCRRLLKLKAKFLDLQEKEPLLLTNYKHLDVTMLGGTFLFVSQKKNLVFISQLTVGSSSQPELLCDAKDFHD